MTETTERNRLAGPVQLNSVSHITLPCRDAQEAKRFWVTLFDATIEVEQPFFTEVRLAGMNLGFIEGAPLVSSPETESPHVGFAIGNEGLMPLKAWLEANGVPTQALWTRGRHAHMYFRDPSANLFEVVCPDYPDIEALPRPRPNGGDLVFHLGDLFYDWHG